MTRLQMRHHNGAPFTGLGLAGLAVGLLAGLATGAYLAHRLGGSGRVAALVRRTRSRAGSVARELEAEAGEIDTRDLEDEDQDYAVDDILDDESGDDWDDENDEDDDDGDAYDDDDAFSSADPDLEERVLEAFTNDPILSERAVDIGAIRASTIELVGTVFSDEELDYATTLTGGVPGVEKVVNRLVVREPTDAKGTTHRSAPPADRATGGRTDDGPTAATGEAQESRPPESPARPPVRIGLDRPAFGDFYFQAFNGSVSSPLLDITTTVAGSPSVVDLHPLEWQLASLHGQNREAASLERHVRTTPKSRPEVTQTCPFRAQ